MSDDHFNLIYYGFIFSILTLNILVIIPNANGQSSNNDEAIEYYTNGLESAKKGEYDKALIDLTQAIKINSNYSNAYNTRGAVYFSLGEFEKALDDFNQAIKLDSNLAKAYYTRGLTYYRKGDLYRATADWETVLKIDPNNANAKQSMETVQKQLKDRS